MNRRLLGYLALGLALLGLGLFFYDAFIERDGATDYISLIIGASALAGAVAILRKSDSSTDQDGGTGG